MSSGLLAAGEVRDAARRLAASGIADRGVDLTLRLARRLFGTESAQAVLLVNGQVVSVGLATELPREPATAQRVRWATELCAQTSRDGVPRIVRDASEVTDVAEPEGGGSLLAVPLPAAGEHPVGAVCVHDPACRLWSDEDVALLEDLAGSTVGALTLSALAAEHHEDRVRWDLAIQAAGIGSFDWDLRTDRVDWDQKLQQVFGYRDGEFVPHITEAFSRIHPDDRVVLDDAIREAVESCGDYRAEFRVIPRPGEIRWVAARGRALADRDGNAMRLLGVAYDVTEVRTARDQATRVLSSMSTGFLAVDRDWNFTYLNTEGERILGRSLEELVGRNMWACFPGAEESEFGRHYHRAVETGEATSFEAYYPNLDGWYEVRAVPSEEGLEVFFLDVTKRREAQRDAAHVYARLELLSRISGELAATLDAEEAVARLAQLVVPALADWCLVTLVDEDGRLYDVGTWHADPELRETVERYARVRLDALTERSFVMQALRQGKPQTIEADATGIISEVLSSEEAREVLHLLAPETGTVLPLQGRDRTVGLLSLYSGAARGPISRSDLTTAREVAARAGLALDNTRLYRQQAQLAEGLQRNLLTDPPKPDHADIVVRYQPAAEAAAVGGDWYDAFLQADGATMLVIGDVVGHDIQAAAEMGQLRGLLRGIAYHSGAGPAEVLTGLDAAMEGLLITSTATAVVARLEQRADERARGITRLRWSNAGHPPPMVVNPDGSVAVLAGFEADVLLGLDPAASRVEDEIVVDRGTTVLLYTDGLVERRGQSIEEGMMLLRQTLAELGERDLDELCDELLRRLLPRHAEDDVALVAVRLHPQDGSLPA